MLRFLNITIGLMGVASGVFTAAVVTPMLASAGFPVAGVVVLLAGLASEVAGVDSLMTGLLLDDEKQ